MPDGSSFSDEEIERQRRSATTRTRNVDEERMQLMRDTMQIIQTGTLEQLEEKLELLGKGRNTPEGRELLKRFTALRGASLR